MKTGIRTLILRKFIEAEMHDFMLLNYQMSMKLNGPSTSVGNNIYWRNIIEPIKHNMSIKECRIMFNTLLVTSCLT